MAAHLETDKSDEKSRSWILGSRFGQPCKCIQILWSIFMPHKLVKTRTDFVTMQKYHLRLAFHLSKAETVLRIQSKEMNLTSCYFVAPKTNIFFQYIPLVSYEHLIYISDLYTVWANNCNHIKICNVSLVSANVLCLDSSNTLVCTWTYFQNDSKKGTKWNKASILNR